MFIRRAWLAFKIDLYRKMDELNRKDIQANGNIIIYYCSLLRFMGYWLLGQVVQWSGDYAERHWRRIPPEGL